MRNHFPVSLELGKRKMVACGLSLCCSLCFCCLDDVSVSSFLTLLQEFLVSIGYLGLAI